VSWRALLARLLDSHPRLAWAGLIPQLWTFGTCWNKLCQSVILFSSQRTLPELLHLVWALLPVKPTASGITDHVFLILARFIPASSAALFQGFWILTLISTLGWAYPPVVDFWDLSAKIPPLVFACLIPRLLDSHPHIDLGLMGLSPSCRLLGLVGQNACVFCFLCCGLYPNHSTSCRPLFLALIPGKPMASGLTYQVFVILARFSTACHGWPLFWDSQPYLHWA
jgi:hypothetical protein